MKMFVSTDRLAAFVVVFLVFCTPVKVSAMDIAVAGGGFSVPVVSLKEARFRTVIKQNYDFSCGSAALATLLTYHYQDPVDEQTVFAAMYKTGNKAKIRKEGFSLLDIKRYLAANGYRADGFVAPLDTLDKKGIPAIVLINDHGYKHFVVVKGVSRTQVLLGDPSAGVRIIPRDKFEEMWNKILFVIRDKEERVEFGDEKEWKVREKAPLEVAVSRDSLFATTVLLPNGYDF